VFNEIISKSKASTSFMAFVPFMKTSNVKKNKIVKDYGLAKLTLKYNLPHFQWSCCKAPHMPSTHLLSPLYSIVYWDLQ
jgi:hypothetical protein